LLSQVVLQTAPALTTVLGVTSLMAEASSFMTFTQPQILFCGASPDAARTPVQS
jgi:hypothetical protein